MLRRKPILLFIELNAGRMPFTLLRYELGGPTYPCVSDLRLVLKYIRVLIIND